MKAWQGQGGYGAVYRAERVGWRRSEPGALKLSLRPWNWRMEREVELLSRLNHPSIPRLLDRGGRQPPSSAGYPYFVMEWVEGVPLYAWAEKQASSRGRPGYARRNWLPGGTYEAPCQTHVVCPPDGPTGAWILPLHYGWHSVVAQRHGPGPVSFALSRASATLKHWRSR